MPFDTMVIGKDGKPTWLFVKGSSAYRHIEHKRYRATAVVIQDGKLLLVRDTGKQDFSMPGGGFKKGESTVQAGIRELCEEIGGLTVVSVDRLHHCDFEGTSAKHKVCRIIVSGNSRILQPHEIDKFTWWDMKSELLVQGHVKHILSKCSAQIFG